MLKGNIDNTKIETNVKRIILDKKKQDMHCAQESTGAGGCEILWGCKKGEADLPTFLV